MNGLIQSRPNEENCFIGGELKGHVGSDKLGFNNVHGGIGFGSKNEEGNALLILLCSYKQHRIGEKAVSLARAYPLK